MSNKPLSTFVSALRNGAKVFERRDDDGFDRLSNRYSVGIVVMMAGFITVTSYVGAPVVCFPPAEFGIQWRKYVDNMCWTTNTYYVPFDEQIAADESRFHDTSLERYSETIQYYQWTPILLSFCAFMFGVPSRVWAWASNSGGYDVEAMVKATKGTSNLNPETRDKTVRYLVAQMDRLLGYRRPIARKGMIGRMRQQGKPLAVGKRFGCFLFIMYIFVKMLYIANAVGLIFIINIFLGNGYYYYGIDMIKQMQDPNFKGSPRFPYNTMCDFWVRSRGSNLHRYSVQCVLSVNLFNEKCFIVLWFWCALVAIASTLGLVLWLFTASSGVNRSFARKYLTIMGRADQRDDELLDDFVHNYLRLDGVFCMRLIIKNTNDAIGGEIFAACWDHFLHSRRPPAFDPTTENMLPGRVEEAV